MTVLIYRISELLINAPIMKISQRKDAPLHMDIDELIDEIWFEMKKIQ